MLSCADFPILATDDWCTWFWIDSFEFKIATRKFTDAVDCSRRVQLNRLSILGSALCAVDSTLGSIGLEEFSSILQTNFDVFLWYSRIYEATCPFDIAVTSLFAESLECCVVARCQIARNCDLCDLVGVFVPIDCDTERQMERDESDFSMMQLNSSGLIGVFAGPARFVNHSCRPNCEFVLAKEGRVHLRSILAIGIGEEITVSYGRSYFGDKNKDCECASCRKLVMEQCTRRQKRLAGNAFVQSAVGLKELQSRNRKIFDKEWPLR